MLVSICSTTLAVFILLVFAHCTAAERDTTSKQFDEDYYANKQFGDCFCWDQEKDQWCGGSEFYREPCREWVSNKVLPWAGPSSIVLCFYGFFPFIFCISRLACNCCGGRKPSLGCCCPLPHIPGAPLLQYHCCEVVATKFVHLIVFGGCVALCVLTYVWNHNAHDDTVDLITDFRRMTDTLWNAADGGERVFKDLVDQEAPFVNTNAASVISNASAEAKIKISDIDDILDKVHKFEGPSGGRQVALNWLVSVPLFFYAIMAVLMMFNFRGGISSLSAAVVSLAAAGITLFFLFHGFVTAVSFGACGNYDTAVVPTVIGYLTSKGACGDATLVETVANTTRDFISLQMCQTAGLAVLCSNYFECPENVCATGDFTDFDYLGRDLDRSVSRSDLAVGVFNSSCGREGAAPCRIRDCANSVACTANSTVQLLASSVIQTMDKFRSQMIFITHTFNNTFPGCKAIESAFNGPIKHSLCSHLRYSWGTITGFTAGMMGLHLFGVAILVLGAKRFTNCCGKQGDGDDEAYEAPEGVVMGVITPAHLEEAGRQQQGYYYNNGKQPQPMIKGPAGNPMVVDESDSVPGAIREREVVGGQQPIHSEPQKPQRPSDHWANEQAASPAMEAPE